MLALENIHGAKPLNDVEARLANAFRPVQPSHKFVQTVRRRIKFAPPVTIADRLQDTRQLVLVIGGVLTASLMVATAVRAIFYLINKSRS